MGEQTKRNWHTPVPRDSEGRVKWPQMIALWTTILGLLGGSGGALAMNWPFEPSHQIAKLEEQLAEKEKELDQQKEARLGNIEQRLGAIEAAQQEQSKTLEYIKAKARRWGGQ